MTHSITHAAERQAFKSILDSIIKKGQTQDVSELAESLIGLMQEDVANLLLIRNSGGLQHLRNIFAGGCHSELKDLPAVHLYPRPSAWPIIDIERLPISLRMFYKSKETFFLPSSLDYRSPAAVSEQNARIPVTPVDQP